MGSVGGETIEELRGRLADGFEVVDGRFQEREKGIVVR